MKSLEKLAKLVGTSTNQKLYSFLIYLEQPYANDTGDNVTFMIHHFVILKLRYSRVVKRVSFSACCIYLRDCFLGGANAATIRKQAVSVPGLVYAVEQCERNLIILGKKTSVRKI